MGHIDAFKIVDNTKKLTKEEKELLKKWCERIEYRKREIDEALKQARNLKW